MYFNIVSKNKFKILDKNPSMINENIRKYCNNTNNNNNNNNIKQNSENIVKGKMDRMKQCAKIFAISKLSNKKGN